MMETNPLAETTANALEALIAADYEEDTPAPQSDAVPEGQEH